MGCGCNKGKNAKKWELIIPGQGNQVFTSLAEANSAKRKAGAGATLRELRK